MILKLKYDTIHQNINLISTSGIAKTFSVQFSSVSQPNYRQNYIYNKNNIINIIKKYFFFAGY